MKPQQLVLLLTIFWFASCQKQSDNLIQPTPDSKAIINVNTEQFKTSPPDSIDPANFVKKIDNPYYAQKPGTTFHYINSYMDKKKLVHEDIDVSVTYDTKVILGVTCEVIHDDVKIKGRLTEDTYDWYAQDKQGNIWYFGEDTKEFDGSGGYSTEGSFKAGVKGAKAGIVMWGDILAHVGVKYYQEYLPGVAEDQAKILNANSTAKVAYGVFKNCVETEETTKLSPGEIEHKFYARDVGQVLTVTNLGEREELISITHF